jgi:opacity protein-like surface antigen
MKKLLLVAVVLSLASVVSADMLPVVTENTGPNTPAGYQSYIVGYVGQTAGEELSAFDGNITGSLLQAWYYDRGRYIKTLDVFEFLAGEDASIASDSHILLDLGNAAKVLIASSPDEDATFDAVPPQTPDGYDMGLGTYMSTTATSNMAFAIPSAYQALSTDVFQVVIPAGTTAWLRGIAVAADGSSYQEPVPIPIPEPATMGLLAIGGIGALIRRRR